MGCQSGPTLVGVWPAPVTEPPTDDKADIIFRLARDADSNLVGYYSDTYKYCAALYYDGSFEEAEIAFKTLGYVNEIKPLAPDFKYRPVDEIIISFSHKPLPSGSLLGHKIIGRHPYKDDAVSAGFIVIEVKGPVTPTLIGNLTNMPGVRWFEPNYKFTLDGH